MKPSFDHQNSSSPVIFSFGQENQSGPILIRDNYILGSRCHSKYQFIQSLIDKYAPKPEKFEENMRDSSEDPKVQSSDYNHKYSKKPSLPLKSDRLEKSQEEDKPSKSQVQSTSPSKSEIKAELEESHKEIVVKYQSAVREDSKNQKIRLESEFKAHTEKLVKELVKSEEKSESPKSTLESKSSGSIPMIESVLMSNKFKVDSQMKEEQVRDSPIKELSEFTIQGEEKQREFLENLEPKIETEAQNKQKQEDSDHKIIGFYVVVMLVILYCYFFNMTNIEDL